MSKTAPAPILDKAAQPAHDVVFLPGMLADQRLWQCVVPLLEGGQGRSGGGIRPHFPDMRGYNSIEDMADAIAAMFSTPVVLVGMSMGGYVALELVRRFPGLVSHMLLVNTRSSGEDTTSRRRRELLARMMRQQKTFRGFNDDMLARALDANHPDHRENVAILGDMANALGRDVCCAQQIAVARRRDYDADLPHIAIPCHVMWGEKDAIIPPHDQRDLAAKIPGATWQSVANAAHYVPLEAPYMFVDALWSLLQR
ncbi:alpha/beta fold hydrolase [Thalassospira marina]|uniref:Alpha/beta hydrolase n=1 Tax=Thalassospira marina TaxID=2048283 RepID=A0ABM6Q7S5_9PROT|nr:alpha/beta hydrolase [Thalassospira marina]AUG52550.1 alpha/beta hydrolase [Thalassospira marina]